MGYARYEGEAAAIHLNALYMIHRFSLNYFSPSMKLIGKTRVGARVKKSYDTAKTPWERLQATDLLDGVAREQMGKRYLKLNPAKLRRDIEELEMGLRRFTIETPPLPTASAMRNVTVEDSKSTAEKSKIEKGGSDAPAA